MVLSPSSVLTPLLETIPSLRLRKDIWTHFPVCLIKLPYASDGHDRYAIQWHQKNLDMWCQKIPHYQHIVHLRLLKALASSPKWLVEKPKAPGDLCVIAMQFSEEPRAFHTLPDIRGAPTVIEDIEDIKQYFPICWKSRKNQHILEFHNTFVRALAEKQGMQEEDVRRLTLERLLPALREGGWCVDFPAKTPTSILCTIHRA